MRVQLVARDKATREIEVPDDNAGNHRDIVLPLVPKDFASLTPIADSTVLTNDRGEIDTPHFAHRRYRFVRFETIAVYTEIE